MILRPFFRRHFWLVLAVFAAVVTTAIMISQFLAHVERADFFKAQGGLIFNSVEKRTDKLAYIRELNASNQELGYPFQLDVIQNGKSLLSGEPVEVPSTISADQRIYVNDLTLPEPAKFVVTYAEPPGTIRHAWQIIFGLSLLAVLVASMVSIFLLFWSFRDRANLAQAVLTKLQQGDLKARFPISKLEEVGHLMVAFNQMADEIERLVGGLKQNEKARLQLLQELAHDLRTPVSSLRNLVETLRFEDEKLTAENRKELTQLAFQETEYLTRLVEDLLFLALVLEPKYKADSSNVIIEDLVQTQLTATAAKYSEIKSQLIKKLPANASRLTTGNTHQIKRLLRNALENAFSFAKSKVDVSVTQIGNDLQISIEDNGPGFSQDALENFGKKLSTRYQQDGKQDGRISVGLGSVIMQAIAKAHGGGVVINNITDQSQQIVGAQLVVKIPISQDVTA